MQIVMAYYFVTGFAIFIFALGLEATALQAQNGDMRDNRFLTRREAPPYLDYADIQLLKKIVAVLEADAHQDAYAQHNNAQRYQQMLASAYKGYVQGPSRYDEEMINENREMQQAERKFYNKLQAVAAGTRPGSGGGGSFGGGR